jgi:hypothetical protein
LRDAPLQQARLLLHRRRHDPEEERQDLVAVDDHVQRQDQDEQHGAHRAEAGDRELLERPGQLRGVALQVVDEALGLDDQVDLGEAEGAKPVLVRGEDRRQLVAQCRDARDERRDRLRQAARHEDDQADDHRQQHDVDDHDRADPREDRHERGQGAHERAEDEGEQPGQEEDQEDVAEAVEDRGEQPDQDERQHRRAQDEHGRDERALAAVHLDGQHVDGIVVRPTSPPLTVDRQVNGQKIGTSEHRDDEEHDHTTAPSFQ